MPKQTLKIEGFHGGLNTNADPRDIQDIQSPNLQDVKISKLGRIATLGGSGTASGASNPAILLNNKGLFVMDADRKVSDGSESDESLIIVYDDGGNSFDVYDSGGWTAAVISLDTSHPVFYAADGILRIGDGALSLNGKWYGYIGETKFASLRPEQADTDWISFDQNISTPTSGRCLISNSNTGSDGNTINSASGEYDGNVATGSTRVVEHSSVNLRVGFQHNEIFQNTQTDWERSSSSPYQGTLSEPAESVIYPVLGNNVLLMEGSATSTFHRLVLDNSDSGTELEFQITDDTSLAFGVNISTSEFNNLSYISLSVFSNTIGSGSDIQWRFYKDDLIEWSTNILVCSKTNVHYSGSNADFDETYDKFTILAFQEDGNSSNDAPDIYYHMPVKVKNPQLQGFQPGEYQFHYTFLYDDSKQESLPFTFNDVGNNYNTNKVKILGAPILLNFDAYILPSNDSNAYAFNKRIIGSRLYYTEKENDNYFLIGELDFIEKGFKFFPESDTFNYDIVNTTHTDNLLAEAVIAKDISPDSVNIVDTFKTINGFGSEVKSLNVKYKTAVVHGRRVYVGNIEKDGVKHSDRMMKSRVNRFDTFPSGMGVVDVAIRDGESIVKLEAFADRILQYKQKSLYVINVSENVDFLEDVYRNKGCEFDYHVSKTDYGITWFNKFGVYLFDGKNVTNLLEKDGIRLISESDWETFVTATTADMSKCHIAYIPKRRQILVNNADDDIFLYDLVLRAWTKGIDKTTYDTARTNFALDSDQDLFYIQGTQSQLKRWSSSSESTDKFIYETKDIDFGQPSVRKKIYKVYMSYKGNGTNVQVHYGVNGLSPSLTFNSISSGTDGSSTGSGSAAKCIAYDAGTTDWLNAELKPSAPVNNINSFRLKISADGTSDISSDFEINDITIVYRLKNIK